MPGIIGRGRTRHIFVLAPGKRSFSRGNACLDRNDPIKCNGAVSWLPARPTGRPPRKFRAADPSVGGARKRRRRWSPRPDPLDAAGANRESGSAGHGAPPGNRMARPPKRAGRRDGRRRIPNRAGRESKFGRLSGNCPFLASSRTSALGDSARRPGYRGNVRKADADRARARAAAYRRPG